MKASKEHCVMNFRSVLLIIFFSITITVLSVSGVLAFENNFADYNKGMYSDVEQKSVNRRKVTAINRAHLAAHRAKEGAEGAVGSVMQNDSSGPIGGVVIEGDNSGDIIIINDIKGDVTSIGK